MRLKYILNILSALFLLVFLTPLRAQQDIPVSPEQDPTLLVSPATVALKSHFRVDINYKSQMRNAFNNAGSKILYAGYEQSFLKNTMGFGMAFFSNTLNKSALTDWSFMAAYRYSLFFAENNHSLSFGIQGAFRQWFYNVAELSFGSQYDPAYAGGYNPALMPDLPITESKNIFDAAFGLDYRGRLNSYWALDLGASFYHLTQPKTDFMEKGSRLQIRYLGYARVHVDFTQQHRFSLVGSVNAQGSSLWGEFGPSYRAYFSSKLDQSLALGLYYRTTQVFVPTLAFQLPKWSFFLAFDFYTQNTYANMGRLGLAFHW